MPNELRKILLDTFQRWLPENDESKAKSKLIDDFIFATNGRYRCRKYVSKILSGKVTPVRFKSPVPRLSMVPKS